MTTPRSRLLTSLVALALLLSAWGWMQAARAGDGAAGAASSERIAPMPAWNTKTKAMMAKMGKTRAEAEKEVPTKAELPVPVYPGALFVSGTSMTSSDGVVMSANLVSKDAPAKVTAWYREHLGPDWTYDERWKIFVQGAKSFSPAKIFDLTTITVLAEKGDSFDLGAYDLHGLKSRIQINRPLPKTK